MDRATKDQKKRELKVKMMGMLEDKVGELTEVFGDMIDDLAAEMGIGPDPDEERSSANYDEYCGLEADIEDAAKRQFGLKLHGSTVWGLLSFNPEFGVELEFFGDRPHTADGDRNNWPKWFRLYEGNINGGDSIIVDARGEGF